MHKVFRNISRILFGLLMTVGIDALSIRPVAAQSYSDDEYYYPYAEREERRPLLTSDTTLFYRAVQGAEDLYGRYTDFALPPVALRRRGLDYTSERNTLSGIGLSYRYFTLLRLLGAEESRFSGFQSAPGTVPGPGGGTLFRFPEGEALQPYLVSVRFADRNYCFGTRVSGTVRLSGGWRLAAGADFRTGRDLHVEGVFTNAVTAGFRLSRTFDGGDALSLLCIVPVSVQGMRLSTSEEAFALTGDRLYNPAWGFQSGRVRNSRVRREMLPLTVAAWETPLAPSTALHLTLGATAGKNRYSSLGWYDARTPMPDNYRYLPSHTGDRATETAWLSDDPHYTQIDWDELIRQNRMAGGHAVYALEDRVERCWDATLRALFTTEVDRRLTLRYGAEVRLDDRRHYKEMRDLLGADHIVDIDQYLIDDDTYGTLLQNDLRHPDRTIRAGDRFGYDYTLTTRHAQAFFEADYRSDRFLGALWLSLGHTSVNRRGHYEKELFPGSQSCGPSRTLRFAPWTVRATAGWSFTPRHYASLTLLASSRTPEASDLFYQPLYNNRTVGDARAERSFAAEAAYRLTGPRVDFEATLFTVLTLDGMQTRRYYDDMSYVYCDLAVTGIGTWSCGVELAADIRLADRWELTLAASAGRYRYVRDPVVTVLSDVDNTPVDRGSRSRMGGCAVGGAPQLTAAGELSWFGRRGWGVHLSTGYAGRRFVEPMPLRRTDRLAGQGGITPETCAAFIRQERLPDAFTLDGSLFKTFWFSRSRLTVSLLLKNLLGDSDIPYNGYESLRVRRISSGDATFYTPHATRYTYLLPRTFYLTVSYRF